MYIPGCEPEIVSSFELKLLPASVLESLLISEMEGLSSFNLYASTW
jgi:hypothetical protein